MAKQKYHRGRPVKGLWVVGVAERTQKRRLFVENVQNRSAKTLIELLNKSVK